MGQCLCPSLLGATRRRSLLQQAINNIIRSICHPVTLQISLAERMGMLCFLLRSFPFQKVSFAQRSPDFESHFVIVASKRQRKKPLYQKFCRQLYHASLALVFRPLKAGMLKHEVVKCPDGHFRRAIYGLGPYIADYPEQVWLSGTVQGWCPKYIPFLSESGAL